MGKLPRTCDRTRKLLYDRYRICSLPAQWYSNRTCNIKDFSAAKDPCPDTSRPNRQNVIYDVWHFGSFSLYLVSCVSVLALLGGSSMSVRLGLFFVWFFLLANQAVASRRSGRRRTFARLKAHRSTIVVPRDPEPASRLKFNQLSWSLG